MDALIGGVVIVLLLLGFMPAVRGVAAGIDSVENPTRQETEEERRQGDSDLARLFMMLTLLAGMLFLLKLGAI